LSLAVVVRRPVLAQALVIGTIALVRIVADVIAPPDLALVRGRVRQQWLGHNCEARW
jgi:hypothetical protein